MKERKASLMASKVPKWSRCSASMLVTMATSAGSFRKVPSDSSASTTIQCALAHARVGAVGVDDAAVDDGRIEAAGVEQGGDERRRRRLAVRAGDGDAGLEAHQLGQHLGAAHHRQALLARRRELRIVALDRRRDDHDLGPVDILGLVADEGA